MIVAPRELTPEEITEVESVPAIAEQGGPRELYPHEVAALTGGTYENLTKMLNVGIAQTLGGPVDLADWKIKDTIGEELYGKIFSGKPFLGSKYIQGWMADKGIAFSPDEPLPDTLAGSVGKAIGAAAGTLVPFGAATKGLAAAKNATTTAAAIVQNIARQAVESPKTFMATDAAVALLSGLGGYEMRKAYPDSDVASLWGETLGGLSPITLPVVYNLATRFTLSGNIFRIARNMVEKTIEGLSPDGAKVRVETRFQTAAGVPGEAVRNMQADVLPEANLTPAQKTSNRGLLAIEKAVLESSDTLKNKSDIQISEATKAIRGSLEDLGGGVPIVKTEEQLQAARQYVSDLVDTRVRIALQRSEERLGAMKPRATREENNLVTREELTDALAAARAQESAAHNAVPSELIMPTAASRTAYQEIIANTPLAQREDIPGIARTFLGRERPVIEKIDPDIESMKSLSDSAKNRMQEARLTESAGKFGDEVELGELQGLRSKLLEDAREARAAGHYNKARIAGIISDAILDDLGAQAGNVQGEAGAKLRFALDVSRDLNDRFNSGTVGRILGTERRGPPRVAEALTLEVSTGTGGPKARVATQAMLDAADTPVLRGAVEDFLRDEFQRMVIRDGKLSDSGFLSYMKKYRDVFFDFPELKKQVADAFRANESAIFAQKRADGLARTLNDPKISKAAVFLKEPTDDAFKRVASSSNPGEVMKELVRQVGRDETGEALNGLKTGFGNYLLAKATIRAETAAGDNILSGKALTTLLGKGPVADMAKALFTPQEIDRLNVIAATAKRIEIAISTPAAAGIILDSPSLLVSYLARFIGAAAGRRIGRAAGSGGTVQIPGMASDLALKVSQRAIKDPALKIILSAVQDEELFRALLTDRTILTKVDSLKLQNRLNGWLAGLDAPYLSDQERETDKVKYSD